MTINRLPISRKAYTDFLRRIRQVYSSDPETTSAMEKALRLYLDNDSSYSLALSAADRIAFEFLRQDIDVAIDRSRRARERARLRKEALASASTSAKATETDRADNPVPNTAEEPATETIIPGITLGQLNPGATNYSVPKPSSSRSQRRSDERQAKKNLLAAMRRLRNSR